jgi:hypothetical protein
VVFGWGNWATPFGLLSSGEVKYTVTLGRSIGSFPIGFSLHRIY